LTQGTKVIGSGAARRKRYVSGKMTNDNSLRITTHTCMSRTGAMK
jgi:hypothetical protein